MSDQFEFYRKVNQTAHEMRQRHGWGAHGYAAKLSKKAEIEGNDEDRAFWQAVEATLTPRSASAC